jgi:hypothetical protein
MSRIRRRHFLQLAGSSLAAIGLSQVDFLRQGNQMHRALAQDTSRKLALLVGINGYPTGISSLGGCVNDVRLQYELLVHRYGFNPQDIVIVTDAASAASLDLAAGEIVGGATRSDIISRFRSHLIDQAQPGDVAVFHYSGHGSYVADPHPIDYSTSPAYLDIPGYANFDELDGTLVPTDALSSGNGSVNDIMGSTLFLLSRLVKTDNLTVVLDSCHSGGGVRGNLTYRSINRDAALQRGPSPAELALQETLRAELDLSQDEVQALRQAGIARGVALGAARANQLAAEQPYEGFSAGIFTYLLTRYLWQAGNTQRQVGSTQPLESMFVDLARITRAEDEGSPQDPIYFVQPGTTLDQQPPYLLTPTTPPAEAVMRGTRGEAVEMWLGGVTPKALAAEGSIYEVLGENNTPIARLRQEGQRIGLKAFGRFIDDNGRAIAPPIDIVPGTLLREEIRGIPGDLTLRIGLHESLGEEWETAFELLSGYRGLEPVQIEGNITSDVLLGRFNGVVQTEAQQLGIGARSDVLALEANSLGIFRNDLAPLTDTFGSQFETVGEAISRLFPRLKLLLAKRALEVLENDTTAQLALDLEVSTTTRRGLAVISSGSDRGGMVPEVPLLQVGEELTLSVTNQQAESLYVAVLATEDNGNMYVYHPSNWNAPEIEAQLGPGEQITIPNGFRLPVSGPSGYFNVLVIASRFQLRDTLRSLQRIAERSRASRGDTIVIFDDSREASRSTEDSAFSLFRTVMDDSTRSAPIPTAADGALDRSAMLVFSATLGVVE